MRNGIIAGGNLIADNIKIIDYFPSKNMMCNIVKDIIYSVGGSPHNVLVNLSRLSVGIPLSILGLVGNDLNGDLIINSFKQNKINTQYITKISDKNTSFTDVFTEILSGSRTFFHYAGANAELNYEHFLLAAEESSAKIFLLANLLHLDSIDEYDSEYGMVSAKILSFLVKKGFKTAVDLVSVKSNKFDDIVKYCLKYIHYLIINEIEAQSMSGLTIRVDSNTFNIENLYKTSNFLLDKGVLELVVIHLPEGGFAMDKNHNSYWIEALKVNNSEIKSTVGCGDAFHAGMLYSLHQDLPLKQALQIANACARFCLLDYTTTGGATTLENIMNFISNNYN